METTKEVAKRKYENYISNQHLMKFPEDETQWLHNGGGF